MQQIKEKMAQLTKAHSRVLMPTFDELNGHKETVEKLSTEITRLLKEGEQKLKRLSMGDLHSEERRNVQRLLATDLQQLSMDFREQQKAYLQRLRRQQEGSLGGSASIAVRLSERPRVGEDSCVESGFSDYRQLKLKEAEGLAPEREKEIVQIMDSVSELAQIMKDLSVLVIEQGTIIDRIDYNMENVATQVESGVKQLRQAERKQKQSSMAMCIMVRIVLCLFMIVVLIRETPSQPAAVATAASPCGPDAQSAAPLSPGPAPTYSAVPQAPAPRSPRRHYGDTPLIRLSDIALYDGTGIRVSRWLQSATRTLQLMGATPETWVGHLSTRLRGGPFEAWEDFYAYSLREGRTPTFVDFQVFLEDRFGARYDVTDAFERVVTTRWSDSGGAAGLDRHIQVFQDARLDCDVAFLPEAALIDRFLASPRLEYRSELWRYEFTSAPQAYEAARDHQRMRARLHPASSSQPQRTGYASSSSHGTSQCRSPFRGRPRRSTQQGRHFSRRFSTLEHGEQDAVAPLSSEGDHSDDLDLCEAVHYHLEDSTLHAAERLQLALSALSRARSRPGHAGASPPEVPLRRTSLRASSLLVVSFPLRSARLFWAGVGVSAAA
ncbi:hypothetical protein CBR_g45822 [Chara braunii]|uniref:t-SNARE coiled-coil homology domain-containing protein n=1 Tax=Chara braunii TaxID=69332 RepID=A0A388LZB9_CHABU|nr:hypothetical protein CBR_g45822 [Chara braunii]|eukprot:GBG87668.1 hypothetical protein CBR_g45822 [Chara braunii]